MTTFYNLSFNIHLLHLIYFESAWCGWNGQRVSTVSAAGSPSYLITAASQATPASVLIGNRCLYIVAGPLLGPSLPEVEPGPARGGVR